jgi:2-keto-4-pentenoate hydratase
MALGFEQLARDLADAWRSGGTIPLPPAGQGPTTRAEAYDIQDRMAELIGGAVAGWKVGATVRAVQLFEGHDGPLPGRIFADRCYDSPARVPAGLFSGVKVECEFAFRLTRDLPKGTTPIGRAEIANALTFHPAFELAGSRFAPGTGNRAATTFDGIADNGSGGAAVLGAAVAGWQKLAFETMEINARIDDSPPIQIYTGAYRRDPVVIVAETLSDLRARGVALPRGTCVLTGSLSLPTPVRKLQTVTAKFADLPALSLTMV